MPEMAEIRDKLVVSFDLQMFLRLLRSLHDHFRSRADADYLDGIDPCFIAHHRSLRAFRSIIWRTMSRTTSQKS